MDMELLDGHGYVAPLVDVCRAWKSYQAKLRNDSLSNATLNALGRHTNRRITLANHLANPIQPSV
eukprot:4699256-Pyramimonas_sp.AAC.1